MVMVGNGFARAAVKSNVTSKILRVCLVPVPITVDFSSALVLCIVIYTC